MEKKKPNYKLRRTIAKIIVVLLILLPIILINKNKITHIPLYLTYKDHTKLLDTFFSIDYSADETKDIIEELKKKKLINDIKEDFIIKLNEKGYNHNTINYLLLNVKKTQITKLLNKDYQKDLEEYITIDLFDYDKYDRYVSYYKKYKIPKKDIIIRVELNLDKDDYDEVEEEKNPDSNTALVNKHNYVGRDYVPKDLVDMDDDYANNLFGIKEMRKEAYEQFKKLVDDMNKAGLKIRAESAYRDYDYQETLYRNYVLDEGQEKADKYAAKAGYSEHELGTAIDVANDLGTIETSDPEYKWLDKNAYKYGYIIRYKKEKEAVTGYAEESWHIRYVGVDAATTMQKKNISFDEYYILYVKNKKR